MKLKPKTELLTRIINLIVIFGICLIIYLNGIKLDCDNCSISLTTHKPNWTSTSSIEVVKTIKINELYDSLLSEDCVLKWNKDSGWNILNGTING